MRCGLKQFSKMAINSTKLWMAALPLEYSESHYENATDYYQYTYENTNFSNTTDSSDYDIEEDYGLVFAYKVGDILTHYYTPALVLSGSIGNILSVIVFFRTKLRKLSSSYYLAALGISDTCFLLVALVSWLNYININIYNKDYYCQFFTYVSGLCSFLSVWFVVAFTVERFIAVLYPLKRQTMCTVKRACMVLCGLCVIGCVISVPYFAYAAPIYSEYLNDYVCDVRDEYKFHMEIFNYFDTAIVFVIPFTTIVILNTYTALAVWKVAGVRRTMTIQTRKSNIRGMRPNSHIHNIRLNYSTVQNPNFSAQASQKIPKRGANSSQIKVTKMLLLVSTVFVCLNLPSYIMRIKAFLVENDEKVTQTTVMTQYICWFLFFTNFGINFVLYCLSGQNFRKAVISMFSLLLKRKVRPPDAGATQVTVSEYLRSSSSIASSKRRIVTRNGSSGNDVQELQCFNNGSLVLSNNIKDNHPCQEHRVMVHIPINSRFS